jgi:hypothetical protein
MWLRVAKLSVRWNNDAMEVEKGRKRETGKSETIAGRNWVRKEGEDVLEKARLAQTRGSQCPWGLLPTGQRAPFWRL